MRRGLLLATFLIPACSTMAANEPQPPVRGETPGQTCRDENLEDYVGRSRSAELEAELRRQSGAKIVRWVPKGAMITMDLRSDRLTVWLDANHRIERLNCG
jgi:hypothetical protein